VADLEQHGLIVAGCLSEVLLLSADMLHERSDHHEGKEQNGRRLL
jgi:hypothetical protein